MTVMKHLTLLLTAALLVFNLTACGCSAKDSGSNGSAVVGGETAGTTNDSTSPNTGTSNGEPGAGTGGGANSENTAPNGSTNDTHNNAENGNSLVDDAQNAVNEGIDDVQNALDGNSDTAKNSSAGGVSFRQMMRNGRVHDTDGDLTEGENYVSTGRLF